MVPILVSIIAGHKERAKATSRKNIFSLCFAYVLGIALTYALVGVLAAIFGSSIQVWVQKPLFILLGAAIFILLALSLFGLFDLYLFKGMQNAIANWTRHLKGGSYVGVFCMGVLSILLVSPCTTAPLIGVLLYIGQTGDILFGATTLFVMGIGMGMPLLLVGMSADKWLPRRGPWMEWVKKFFGVLMIGMALWMVTRIGVFSSPHSLDQQFTTITSLEDFDKSRNASAQSHRPIMLDFYADWCESCVSMEKKVFNNKAVVNALSPFTILRIDLTANTSIDEMMMKYFNVIAPPTVLFFDEQGKEVNSKRIVGEVDANEFIERIDTFITAGCSKNATC
jgi:thiol:disulfide interchange protein DsbD